MLDEDEQLQDVDEDTMNSSEDEILRPKYNEKVQTFSMDGLIEDTFIANIQRLNRVKRKLYQCSKECNEFSLRGSSPRRQASRILEALGMNPTYTLNPRRKTKALNDPNLVLFDIECGGDKVQGARDILEVRVNQSMPLFLNTRNQTVFNLQYSGYTGLVSCLNDSGHLNRGTSYVPP